MFEKRTIQDSLLNRKRRFTYRECVRYSFWTNKKDVLSEEEIRADILKHIQNSWYFRVIEKVEQTGVNFYLRGSGSSYTGAIFHYPKNKISDCLNFKVEYGGVVRPEFEFKHIYIAYSTLKSLGMLNMIMIRLTK